MTTTIARTERAPIFRRLSDTRELTTFVALAALVILGSVIADGFFTTENGLTVGQQAAQVGIMAIGATFVIVNAEIDLSVGSIYGLTAISTGMMIQAGLPWPLAVIAGLCIGAAAGLVNGLAVISFRIPSFIVTLGTLSVFRGIALLLSNGAPISLSENQAGVASFSLIGQGSLFGVFPMQLVIFAVVAILAAILLARTRFGFHTYAVGGSAEAARLCGIRTNRVKVWAFVVQGALAGLAGILGLSFLSYVQGVTGTGMELIVISAVIIGGAALFGGSGSILGTVIGVFFIAVLQNILNLRGISSFWQTVATGAVIILAVALDTYMRRRAARR